MQSGKDKISMKKSLLRIGKFFAGLFASIIALIMLLIVWFFLSGDYHINLPNGYSLVRLYSGAVMMVNPERRVFIMPNIDGYKVYDNAIIGHVSSEGLLPDHAAESKPGYFIVDMREGHIQPDKRVEIEKNYYTMQSSNVEQGLDEKQWIDSLKEYGITKQPKLHEPSRFDKFKPTWLL